MTTIEVESENLCFGGRQLIARHAAQNTSCDMRFSVFLPKKSQSQPVPVVYFLSGLTCTEQNVTTKAGAQRYCDEYGLAFVCPDTSPRGEGVADEEAIDLGEGAGFYVNATQKPWSAHYQMYDYVSQELPALIEANFPVTARRSIMGHSMGGHGALVIGLRNAQRYQSISAFSPICAPAEVPWGKKALAAYLGSDEAAWAAYDASQLVGSALPRRPLLLVDIGTADPFLDKQLLPQRLEEACAAQDHPLELRRQKGYDHSYYFISTFIGDHLRHHAAALYG